MADTTEQSVEEQRPKRLLVLDDDEEEIQQLRRHLDGTGYDTINARSAEEALKKIEGREVDLLLLDADLPDVDGVELCRRLRGGSQTATVPVILLTDPLDEAGAARVLESETDDFVSRPFSRTALVLRVRTLLRLKELHDDLVERNQQLQQVNQELMARNRELEQGMQMAHKLQQALLPQKYPRIANISFCHAYTPADAIGGDFFQIIELGRDKVALFLSDVSGHGVRAALVTSAVKTLVDGADFDDRPPGDVLSDLNNRFRAVLGHMAPQIFATGFLMIIDGAARSLAIASAGHPCPLLIRKADMTVSPVMDEEKGGPALGFLGNASYESEHVNLIEEDIVLGFTDGVYEVRNPADQYYGIERTISLIKENVRLIPRDLIQKIISETEAFMETHKRPDDICLVAVEVH